MHEIVSLTPTGITTSYRCSKIVSIDGVPYVPGNALSTEQLVTELRLLQANVAHLYVILDEMGVFNPAVQEGTNDVEQQGNPALRDDDRSGG